MDIDPRVDAWVPAFTLNCSGYRSVRAQAGGSVSPGNVSFSICDTVLAEIDHSNLLESWQALAALPAREAKKVSEAAGERLAEIMLSGIDAADLPEAVADAAVFFLLAMRRYGISDPKRIPACSVMWSGRDNQECVLLRA